MIFVEAISAEEASRKVPIASRVIPNRGLIPSASFVDPRLDDVVDPKISLKVRPASNPPRI